MAARMTNKQASSKRKSQKRKGKSGIVIKPQNRGKFTRWAKARGMSVSQAASAVRKNPKKYSGNVRKMASFARSAKKWKR